MPGKKATARKAPPRNEQTSKPVARQAGKLLGDPATPKKTRAPIASALAQAPDKPKKAAPKKKR